MRDDVGGQVLGQRQFGRPPVEYAEEPVHRLRQHRLDATLLGAEVAPDRARGKACGSGDVVTAGPRDAAFPEQRTGVPRYGQRACACFALALSGASMMTTSQLLSLSDSTYCVTK